MNKINERFINKIKDLKRLLKFRLSKEENSEYFQDKEKEKRANELIIVKKKNENFFRISLSCKYISSAKKIILLTSNKKKLDLILKRKSKPILQIAKMHKKQIECFACVR